METITSLINKLVEIREAYGDNVTVARVKELPDHIGRAYTKTDICVVLPTEHSVLAIPLFPLSGFDAFINYQRETNKANAEYTKQRISHPVDPPPVMKG